MKPINPYTFRLKLGKKVRQIRKEQKITQAQLAFESGLSREQIYKMELGYTNMTLDSLLAIAAILDIHPKELFDL